MHGPRGATRSPALEEQGTRDASERPRHAAWVLVAAGVTAGAVCVGALLLGGGRPIPVPDGLPDAGRLTGWGLRLGRLLVDVTAVGTVGSLLVGAALLPGTRTGTLGGAARKALAGATRWATAWALLTAAVALLTVSDTAAVPLSELDVELVRAVGATDQGVALAVVALLATGIAVIGGRVRTVWACRGLLSVALVGLLPAAVVGHAASATDHDVAIPGLVVHVVAAAVWVGGLSGLLLHLSRDSDSLPIAVRRFSVLALGAYLALAASGVLTVTTRLDASLTAWTSGYGLIVTAKAVALVALGVAGHLHRRWTLEALDGGRAAPFWRMAGVELVVMAAAMGLAAALARTPVPATPRVTEPSHGRGHATLPNAVDPITLGELMTAWRLNAVVLLILCLALTVYAVGLRHLARHGLSWPVSRTAAFAAGLVVALVNFCSGVATYAPAMVSVQIAQLLVALLLVPALLVLGAPLTLGLRVRELQGADRDPRVLRSATVRSATNPVAGAALASALLIVVYRTPLIELSLRSFWVHLLVLALALVAGLVLLWPVMGVDPVPQPRGLAERAACVAGVAGCLGLQAVQLRYGDRLLAGDWFLELRWGWVDPVADQRLGGAIVGAAALVTLLLVVVAAARRGALRRR